MESYLMITQINDFIFCPRSIYFHDVYRGNVHAEFYNQTPQKVGLAAHAAIDDKTYSTRSEVLMGTMVYCEKYKLLGRIDLFNISTGVLTERKYSVTAIYDGFRYQLYAQYFALKEMGYSVREMRLYSKKDNKIYPIKFPSEEEISDFEVILCKMRNFKMTDKFTQNPNKCAHCIYCALCDIAPDTIDE